MLEITDSMMRQPSSVRVALSQLSTLSLLSLESASLRDAKMRVGDFWWVPRLPSGVCSTLVASRAPRGRQTESASLRDAEMRVGAVVGPQTCVWGY